MMSKVQKQRRHRELPKRHHSLIICELGFDEPDPQRPEISLHEVDCYSYLFSRNTLDVDNWLSDWRPHRLSLRKNLITKNFELYKRFDDGEEAIDVASDKFVTILWLMNTKLEKMHQKAWKRSRAPDIACEHKYPIIDTSFCPRYKETWKGI